MQEPSKTVFITGATGFIGQRLASALLEQGHRVQVMVRPEKNTDNRVPKACEQVPVGLTDVDQLTHVIAETDALIYCAGSVRGRKPEDFATANIKGVKAMLEALGNLDSSSVNTPPMLLLSSLAASRPELSNYAHSKFAGEQVLHTKSSLPWTILRPPAVYGPGDQEMLPLLKSIRRGLLAQVGPADQRLSLLHVDDLASAIISWVSAPQGCLGSTYSIDDGTPGGYSWQAIGEAVSDRKYRTLKVPQYLLEVTAKTNLMFSTLLGYQPMLTPGKVRELLQPDWLCDNREFTDATGWKPRLDLKLGAKQLFQ